MSETSLCPTPRTRIRRHPERGSYETAEIHAILDEAYLCTVAFHDGETAHAIPTACWREGSHLYIHGSNGSRLLRALADGAPSCVSVTHLDGLVFARSAFHHSMNYRSVALYGRFEAVQGEAKRRAISAFMAHLTPERADQIRAADEQELAATTVLRIAIDEAVAKRRSGPPVERAGDEALPVWSGVVPLKLTRGEPVPAPPQEVENA